MALTQPWLGLAALALALLTIVLAVIVRRDGAGGAPISGAGRLRSLPRFRALARRQSRLVGISLAGLALATGGSAWLLAGPVTLDAAAQSKSSRDIVLCLDVSGSMAAVDREVIDTYLGLASRLDGERIGFVAFDASAVTVFPLTDDAEYINAQLTAARDRIGTDGFPGTQIGDGTSLIGDGLTSCLGRFDVPEQQRSRTVVLATDNQVSGRELFTMEEAVDRATEAGVLVFGIAPSDNTPSVTRAMTTQLRRTGGDVLLLGPDSEVGAIERQVRAQEARSLSSPPLSDARPFVWPGVVALLVGGGLWGGAWLAGRRR